ncbi:hypothetical protein PENSPDRAFT_694394 [Peniophora sp. CONT]|nr:hypothetical protein PENSPDRAFT_694394 [Peniophora sp. CONT]
MSESTVWTSEKLNKFVTQMQLRISQILHSYEQRSADKNKWPKDILFMDNLLGEVVFTYNIIGHAVLSGIERPDVHMRLLSDLNAAYEQKIDMRWKDVMKTLERFDYLHRWVEDLEDLPFPRWWEDVPVEECDLSTWLTEQNRSSTLDFAMLQGEVTAVLNEIEKVSGGMEDQMYHTHGFLAAASEDLARSSREWAAAHSAIRAQAGMSAMDLPLTTQFTEGRMQQGGQ